jgi:Flp pilus assembly protein TadG
MESSKAMLASPKLSQANEPLSAWRSWLAQENGATLVEFAIASTILFMCIFGILDCSRALYADHFVRYGAEVAARYAMVRGATWKNASCTTPSTESCTATSANVTSLVASLTPLGLDATNNLSVTTTWTGTSPSGASCNSNGVNNSPGCVVQVQVSYSFNFILPLLPANALVLTSTSAVVIAQ